MPGAMRHNRWSLRALERVLRHKTQEKTSRWQAHASQRERSPRPARSATKTQHRRNLLKKKKTYLKNKTLSFKGSQEIIEEVTDTKAVLCVWSLHSFVLSYLTSETSTQDICSSIHSRMLFFHRGYFSPWKWTKNAHELESGIYKLLFTRKYEDHGEKKLGEMNLI